METQAFVPNPHAQSSFLLHDQYRPSVDFWYSMDAPEFVPLGATKASADYSGRLRIDGFVSVSRDGL